MNSSDKMWSILQKSDLPSFLKAQGKHHLILTGRRGAGKTTLFQKVCPKHGPGIRTYALRDPGMRPKAIFLEDLATGETALLGTPSSPRMALVPDALHTVALTALSRKSDFYFIDEIGYLECTHREYTEKILEILNTAALVAVLRKEDTPLSRQILSRQDVLVLDLDDAEFSQNENTT